MMKKLICLLLTTALLMSVMVFSASADIAPIGYSYEDYSESTDVALRDSVEDYTPTGATEPESNYELQYNEGDTSVQVCGFKYYTGLIDLVIPSEYNGKPVTNIAESAFKDNKSIISVTLPETITYIDSSAFKNCSNLETINFNCKNAYLYNWKNYYVSYNVFNECNSVKEINIGSNVEIIPDCAFVGIDIDSISNFYIPENVKTIGGQIFNNDVVINTLEYDAIECEYLGMEVNSEYIKPFSNINTVIIGKNVKNIPVKYESGFEGQNGYYKTLFADTNLSTVIFEDGIKRISGFRDCNQITSIVIPDGVEEISDQAFYNCSKLETIIIPKSVIKVGVDAFAGTDWLSNQPHGAVYINNTLYKYKSTDETEVDIKDGTTVILDYAFSGIENLTSVTLPDSLKEIGNYAFYDCSKLNTIIFPVQLTIIGNNAFSLCSTIKAINIPDNVTSIGSYAFSGCVSLRSAYLGKGITGIPEACFNGCTDLEEINIGNNIEFIGDYAFAESGLVSVFVPDNVSSLGSFAFSSCSNLKEVRLGKGIRIIDSGTFINCKNLEKVTISDSVKQILGYSNHGSYWSSKDFGAFENCSSLTSIVIPDGVEVIGPYVFRGCTNLKNVTLPITLDSIGGEAFSSCTSLSSISIPKNVETIREYAFWNCPKLKDIYFFNSNCQIYNGYETISGSAIIHGYDGSTAQTYAGNYNRTFMLIEAPPTVIGDVDDDGEVNIIDATLIQRHLAEIPVYAYNEAAADIDGDGSVSIIDVTYIQRYLAQLACPTGIGEPIT